MLEMSIIIPHHKDETALERLIYSFHNQKVLFDYEIIVVSNPPSKRAETLLSHLPNVKHIQCVNVGVNFARNLGILEAKAPLLLFLDSDCEIDNPDFLQKHRDLHIKYPLASCIGGTYWVSTHRIRDVVYNYIQTKWLLHGQIDNKCRYLIGGNFSAKRASIEGQAFDETILYGGTETEFFVRLNSNEEKIFLLFMDLKVKHNTHLSRVAFIRKISKQGSGAAYIKQKLGVELNSDRKSPSLLSFERFCYRKQMDFWIRLSQRAYLYGYEKRKASTFSVALKMYFLAVCDYRRLQISDFFKSLENLLRNLPRA